ncbi:MAG: pilus assembly protein [Candidatus Devosia phytovorans]|uniref:Pilus assembly protein n=1 Tax=Candidatus Devosia phytovorans TaxID=3121372 RepID=A0AAJ5VU83_9HYPH|nr:TadE/TadG family type IV pilus assembly protein [Devosia sp.]WEK03573.1 MAG: pilus assembly protein [Devosia sp.]
MSGNAGAAAVEFALILPAMLILYIGANEASALITVDRRVQSVSGTLGDLVARSDTTISSDTMKEYLAAAGGVMTPFPTTDLKQYVTQVKVDADGKTARVVWAKQYINGVYSTNTARPVNSVYALKSASSTTSAMAEIAKGNYVIVAEATTSYLPFYGIVINKPVTLYRENFFMPRFGGSISTP